MCNENGITKLERRRFTTLLYVHVFQPITDCPTRIITMDRFASESHLWLEGEEAMEFRLIETAG